MKYVILQWCKVMQNYEKEQSGEKSRTSELMIKWEINSGISCELYQQVGSALIVFLAGLQHQSSHASVYKSKQSPGLMFFI